MFKKLLKVFAGLQVAIMVMLLASTPAAAADIRAYDDVIIASGDVVNDDLYVAGSRIIIHGTVNGDVLVAGSTITIDGTVNGDVLAFGSTITIDGEVTGSARLGGSTIKVSGIIGEDLLIAGSTLSVSEAAEIGRDLVFGGSSVEVASMVSGDVMGGSETFDITNIIGGDAELYVNNLTIASTATINGNVVYYSDNEADVEAGAVIGGDITRKPAEHNFWYRDWTPSPWVRFWGHVSAYLMVLLLGVIIVLAAPKKSVATVEALKAKPWNSLGWGALVFFATPLAAAIILITIIGIPVSILAMILWGILILASQLVVGLFIGRWIIGRFNVTETRGSLVGALVAGFTILTLVKLIPFFGDFVWWITVLFGIGAIAVLVFRKKNKKNAEPAETVEAIEVN